MPRSRFCDLRPFAGMLIAGFLAAAPGAAGPARHAAGAGCRLDAAAWGQLAATDERPPFNAAQCRIAANLMRAFALLDERDMPNLQARDGPEKPMSRLLRELGQTLKPATKSSAARAGACDVLHYLTTKNRDAALALHAMELATLLDGARPDCTRMIGLTLKGGPDANDTLTQAAELCEARNEPHCADIPKAN